MMKSGTKVEVYKVWAATKEGNLHAWFSGYEFIDDDERGLLLKRLADDAIVRYPTNCVRVELAKKF